MDSGAFMENLGQSMVQFGMGRYNAKQEDKRYAQRQQDEQAARQEYAQFMARLNPPPERQREVWDQEKQMRQRVTETWQPGDGDQSQGPPAAGRWMEERRDAIAPKDKQAQITSYRQGDDTVTAVIDPDSPDDVHEIGRGPTFDPRARQGKSGGGAAKAPKPGKLVRVQQGDGTLAFKRENPDGTLSDATDEDGNPVTGVGWRPRQGRAKAQAPGAADAIGPGYDPDNAQPEPVFVDPSAKREALGQFSGKAKPAAKEPEKPAAKPGSSPAAPIEVASAKEADSLPPGTYVRLNGRIARVD